MRRFFTERSFCGLLPCWALLLFIFSAPSLSAQSDTVYTYFEDGSVSSRVILTNGLREGEALFYYQAGRIRESITYQAGRIEGAVNRYFENGQLKEFFNIQKGKLEGPKTSFDSTGKILTDFFYSEGVRQSDAPVYIAEEISGTEEEVTFPTLKEGSVRPPVKEIDTKPARNTPSHTHRSHLIAEDDPAFFLTADVPAEPVGGIYAIQNKRVVPEAAKKKGITGTVEVRVLLDRNGEAVHAEVIKGIGGGCDEAAEIAVYYARYLPARINEKPVNSMMIIPVEF
ncbi:MAG: hypothetical protein AMXMBFR48_27260 [Ignavibacteriales bacterium]|jgi:TonB family protein